MSKLDVFLGVVNTTTAIYFVSATLGPNGSALTALLAVIYGLISSGYVAMFMMENK